MWKKEPKQLYAKLFYRYSLIIILIVLALVLYFLSATRSRILETNLNYLKMMTEKAVSYLEGSKEIVDNIHRDFDQSETAVKDLMQYFSLNAEEYQEYRLNAYMGSANMEYMGFDDFIEKSILKYSSIIGVELTSYTDERVTRFFGDGKRQVRQQTQERKNKLQEGNLAGKGRIAFSKEIRNPINMESIGSMAVYFRTDEFEAVHEYYDLGNLTVYNQNHTVIYQSDNRDMEVLFREEKEGKTEEEVLASHINKENTNGYTVLTYIGKSAAAELPLSVFLTVMGVGIVLVGLGEWGVYSYLMSLNERLSSILNGMNSVMTGDLSVRIETEADGDELDVIAGNFNEMCQKLERYIQKSYLAEIQQKNAELEALQSQINPHFLYNTLESIRMKAICNGDRDVARMLYSMAVIFRSQVKDEDIITVVQELHYCKKYMELFEYRYPGKFIYRIDCPEELMNYPVIKFLFQPVIENYFVHGIASEQTGNRVDIRVQKVENALLIYVEDNGRGMTEEELAKKNEEFMTPQVDTEKSIGLRNVNTRIKALYGPEYGLHLYPGKDGGLLVLIKVGLGDKKTYEESNVSRG